MKSTTGKRRASKSEDIHQEEVVTVVSPTPSEPQTHHMRRPHFKAPLLLGVMILAFLSLAGVSGYFFYQYQEVKGQLGVNASSPSSSADIEKEVASLLEEVGRVYELPGDEHPELATVSDVKQLANQEFFKRAQNGDKVLIFANAKKAVLYRPSTSKIIEVGPVSMEVNSGTAGSAVAGASDKANPTSEEENPPAKVVLYNGTTTVGLTRKVEAELSGKDLEVVARENASRSDFESTTIIILDEKYKDVAEELASSLNGIVGELPNDEVAPKDASILVILGSDYVE